MKALFVIPGLTCSSPIRWLVSLILCLPYKSKISLLVLDGHAESKELYELLTNAGVDVIFGEGRGVIGLVKNILTIRKLHASNNFGFVFSMLLRADLAVSFGGIKNSACSVRNDILEEYHYNYGNIWGRIFSKIHIEAIKRFRVCIVMSSGMQNKLVDAGVKVTKLIPNSLDVRLIEEQSGASESFWSKRADNVTRFVMVGSLIPRKRVRESIEIFSRLFDKGYDFELLIVGDGPLREPLETFLDSLPVGKSGQVKLVGHVDNPIPCVAHSDIVFMNSSCEGVSRSILEAAYLNKVIVSRINDGIEELRASRVVCNSFSSDEEAVEMLANFLNNSLELKQAELPCQYFLESVVQEYCELFENINGRNILQK